MEYSLRNIYRQIETGVKEIWEPPSVELQRTDLPICLCDAEDFYELFEDLDKIKLSCCRTLVELKNRHQSTWQSSAKLNVSLKNRHQSTWQSSAKLDVSLKNRHQSTWQSSAKLDVSFIEILLRDLSLLLKVFLFRPSDKLASAIVCGLLNPFSVPEKLSLQWLLLVFSQNNHNVIITVLNALVNRIDFRRTIWKSLQNTVKAVEENLTIELINNLYQQRIPHSIFRVCQLLNSEIDCTVSVEHFILKVWLRSGMKQYLETEQYKVEMVSQALSFLENTSCDDLVELVDKSYISIFYTKVIPSLVEPETDHSAYFAMSGEELSELIFAIQDYGIQLEYKHSTEQLELIKKKYEEYVVVEMKSVECGMNTIISYLQNIELMQKWVTEVLARESMLQDAGIAVDSRKEEMILLAQELRNARSTGYISYSFIIQLRLRLDQWTNRQRMLID